MTTSIKVKDNSNIGLIIIPFCLFPLVFIALSLGFDLSYLLSFLILFVGYTAYMIFIIKLLKKEEEIYAIVANKEEVTFLKSGTFKWEEIIAVKAIDDNSIFTKRPQYYIDITLKNGKNLRINVTNYDYRLEELVTILKSLGKLDSKPLNPLH